MYRICDICKCKKFRIKRVLIDIEKTSSDGKYITQKYYQEARYMCPNCIRLFQENKLTNNEVFS